MKRKKGIKIIPLVFIAEKGFLFVIPALCYMVNKYGKCPSYIPEEKFR